MVSDNWPLTHTDHTQTHMINKRHTHVKTHTYTHTEKGSVYWEGTPSLFLSLLLPPPSLFLCHSLSVRTPLAPVALAMRCRQRPQHVHCLGDERQADTRSASIRPCVRPSLPPFPRLSPVSWPPLILLTIFPRSPSSLSLSLSLFLRLPAFFFSPVGSGGAVTIKKHYRNKQTPPPTSLVLSPALSPSFSPAPLLLQSQHTHLPICVFSAWETDMGGGRPRLFSDMESVTLRDSSVCLSYSFLRSNTGLPIGVSHLNIIWTINEIK